MGFIDNASKKVCGARGVTVIHLAKAGLSFHLELHGGADAAACTCSGHDVTSLPPTTAVGEEGASANTHGHYNRI